MRTRFLMLLLAALASPGITAAPTISWVEHARGTELLLDAYDLAFAEEFDSSLSFRGPKLFAPIHAPYGAGIFDDPAGKAYTVADGRLILTAYKENGKWRSGSVQTADNAQSYSGAPFQPGKGFACKGCYFEARIKFPPGRTSGFWGGFWLLSPDNPKTGHVEIDVIEWYGGDPKGHHHVLHAWPKKPGKHFGKSNYVGMNGILTDGAWHSYGAQVVDRTVFIYMDRKEVARAAVPADFAALYYPLVSLTIRPEEARAAVGPMQMEVDYIRAYRSRGAGAIVVSQ